MVGLIIRESELGTRPNERTNARALVHLVSHAAAAAVAATRQPLPPSPFAFVFVPPSFLPSFFTLRARALLQFPVGVQGQAAFLRQKDRQREGQRARMGNNSIDYKTAEKTMR